MPSSISSSIKWPIIGIWQVAGCSEFHPGVLSIEDGKVYLKIFLTQDNGQPPFVGMPENHPSLIALQPPKQPTIFGETRSAGRVTLFNCARLRLEALARTHIEITLLVSEVWAGAGFVDVATNYKQVTFSAAGLHGVLSRARIEPKWLVRSRPKHKSDTHRLKTLTGADQAYLYYHGEETSADIMHSGKPYRIAFATSLSHTSSSTDGVSIRTTDCVRIETPGATQAELMAVAYNVEQFLTILCIAPFLGQDVELELNQSQNVGLISSLRREALPEVRKTLPHQILAGIAQHPQIASSALTSWFTAADSRQLARWLIVDSLFDNTWSTANFLAVAQAWEIVGRDEDGGINLDKNKYAEACEAARIALEAHLTETAAKRLYDLLKSSNRKSFGDMVREVLKKIPPAAVQALCQNVDSFVTAVVRVRNVLTHMQSRSDLSIDKASRIAMLLTYKLIVLFCIYDCVSLGLPLDNLGMMLANNHTAIAALRPLPPL
ncbi:MAG: HEPN domain-containing protein [Rhodomicrobium sp.]